jgi:uncharacterized protein
VETLADLDVELAQTYKAYRAGLEPAAREAAVQEQREWLKQRDVHCVIYKFWVECLEERYKARIAELQARVDVLKKQTAAQAAKPAHQE